MPESTRPNHILSCLKPGEFALLDSHLESVDLPVRRELEGRHKRIRHVYFIDAGIASVVANGSGDRSIEVGIIGREGMTGLAVLTGTDRSPNQTFMQVGGHGRRISAVKLRQAIEESAALHGVFLRFMHAFMIQASQTALANGRSKIEERLARWLLMAHDRLDGDELPLTHEFLATMLGVRRPGVTVALNALASDGLIQRKRGGVVIVDRGGLEKNTNGAYGAPEAELRRLFPTG